MEQQQMTPEQLQYALVKSNGVVEDLVRKIANLEYTNSTLNVDLIEVKEHLKFKDEMIEKLQKELEELKKQREDASKEPAEKTVEDASMKVVKGAKKMPFTR